MKITESLYRDIRKLYNEGKSKSEISRLLGIGRITVAKYCEGEKIPGIGKQNITETGFTTEKGKSRAEFKEKLIDEVLQITEDYKKNMPAKPKITLLYIHKIISEKYNLSYPTFCRIVKSANLPKKTETFIPLSYEPGEVMQVDFCQTVVNLEGVDEMFKVDLFCSVLLYSYDIFAMVFPNQQRSNFMAGHQYAFEYYGGVPQEIWYDNATVAIDGGAGKTAIENPTFTKFRNHYCFESKYMNPYRGSEKGGVENLCKLIRGLAFSPKPKGKTLSEIQEHVMSQIVKYRETRSIKGREASILEMSINDRSKLNKLPKSHYPIYPVKEVKISKFITFGYDNCEYSVPSVKPGTEITIKIKPYEIECYHMGELLVTHNRSVRRNEKIYIPEHYIEALKKKPRSIKNAAPLSRGKLAPELEVFREKCQDKNKNEQLIQIMLLGNECDEKTILEAVSMATDKYVNPNIGDVRRNILYLQQKGIEPKNDSPEKFEDIPPIGNELDSMDFYSSINSPIPEESSDNDSED